MSKVLRITGTASKKPRTTITDLPPELLVDIFRLISPGGDEESWPYHSRELNLYNICLVNRRLNGPATTALYERVELGQRMRGFFHTVSTNPRLAALVGSVKCEHVRQWMPMDLTQVTTNGVVSNLRSYARDNKLPFRCRLDKRMQRMTCDHDAEKVLTLAALPNVRALELDLEISGPSCGKLFAAQPIKPLQTSQAVFLKAPRFRSMMDKLHSLVLESSSTKYDDGKCGIDIAATCSVFGLKSLKYLTLKFFGTDLQRGTALTSQLKKACPGQCAIRHMTLLNCELSSDDLNALGSVLDQLHSLTWDFQLREMDVAVLRRTLTSRCLAPAHVLSAFLPATKTLQAIEMRVPDQVSKGYWRVLNWSKQRFERSLGISRLFDMVFQPCDLSVFTALRTLAFPAAALSGFAEKAEQFRIRPECVPSTMHKLQLRVPCLGDWMWRSSVTPAGGDSPPRGNILKPLVLSFRAAENLIAARPDLSEVVLEIHGELCTPDEDPHVILSAFKKWLRGKGYAAKATITIICYQKGDPVWRIRVGLGCPKPVRWEHAMPGEGFKFVS